MDTIASQAIADPNGVRRALWDYGAIIGYPAGKLGMLYLERSGKPEWLQKLLTTHPALLGLAWQAATDGRVPDGWDDTIAPESAEKGKEMPVLQPSVSLEPGVYGAVVSSIEEIMSKFEDREVPQLQFQFVVLDADMKRTDQEIRGFTSAKWGNRCKLTEWAKIILGKKCPGPNEPFDTDMLLNRKCDIVVEEVQTRAGGTRSAITSLYPYKTVSARQEEAEEEPF